ncbi:hypothetical protein Bhyg_15988 [Pseudolycoriella hygida]|uniref:Uncharacterized protein n=1 Tax=Pseudolycoriella hygida TaxID=35572 RepID=A0A9Q0MK62_9DIPT|nr:hypothetical protein Bhyg_15988 [Pseudolycoriella hygida]
MITQSTVVFIFSTWNAVKQTVVTVIHRNSMDPRSWLKETAIKKQRMDSQFHSKEKCIKAVELRSR